jgi:acetylornithine/N-succinyldiaminopimelate aminotransferase
LTQLADRVGKLPIVKEVRGSGAFMGIELKEEVAKDIKKKLMNEERVLVHAGPTKKVLALSPSLILTGDQFSAIVDAIVKVLQGYNSSSKA